MCVLFGNMEKIFQSLMVVPLCLGVFGCVPGFVEDNPDHDVGGKGDNPTGNGDVWSTPNQNVGLFAGFDALFDKTKSQCVTPDESLALGRRYTVGGVSETFEFVYVSSRDQLAGELGIESIIRMDPDQIFTLSATANTTTLFDSPAGSVRSPDQLTVHWRPPDSYLEMPSLTRVLLKRLRQAAAAL